MFTSYPSFQNFKKQKGFTLVEILVVVGLIVVTIGVSSDIILSLVRSYSKTKVINEVEQNANFAVTKLTKELRTAKTVKQVSNSLIVFDREVEGVLTEISYQISDGGLQRKVGSSNYEAVIDPNLPGGVRIVNASFTRIQTNPDVIHITLTFNQANLNAQVSFTGEITIEDTVVVRSTY